MPGFSGQGKVLVGGRLASGQPDILRWVGRAPVFEVEPEEDTVERNETWTGQRLPLRRLTRSRKGTLRLVFDEFSIENMALAWSGESTLVAAGQALTDVVLAATPANPARVGYTLALPNKNVSAVAVKDSSAQPKLLTAGVNYVLDDFAGTIDIVDLTQGGPFTMPLRADYTPGAVQVVGAFKRPSRELYIRLNGINTDDGSRCIYDIFRARLSPPRNVPLIGDDLVDFELRGTVMADLTRQPTDRDGQFYSLTVPVTQP